jgi:hypothetical protein
MLELYKQQGKLFLIDNQHIKVVIAIFTYLGSYSVPTIVKVYPGLPHAFYIYPQLPSTAVYLQTMVDWIAKNFQEKSAAEGN